MPKKKQSFNPRLKLNMTCKTDTFTSLRMDNITLYGWKSGMLTMPLH